MPQQLPGGPFQVTFLDPNFDQTAQATLWFTDDAHCSFVVGTPGQPLQITQQNLNLQPTSTNELQFSFELPADAGGYPAGTYTFTIFAVRPESNQFDGAVTVPGATDMTTWTATATLAQGPFWVQIAGPTFPDTDAISYLIFSAGQANYAVGEFGSNENWTLLEDNLTLASNIDTNLGLQWSFAFQLTNLDQDKADGYCQGGYAFTFNNPTLDATPSGSVSMPNPNDDQSEVTGTWTGTPLLAGTQPFTMAIPSTDFTAPPVVLSFPDNGNASLVVGQAASPVVNQIGLPIHFDDNNAALYFEFHLKGNGPSKTPQNGGWIDGTYTFHFFLPVWTKGGAPDPTQLWGILKDPYKDPRGDEENWTAQTNPPTEDETAALSHGVGKS